MLGFAFWTVQICREIETCIVHSHHHPHPQLPFHPAANHKAAVVQVYVYSQRASLYPGTPI
jgi:hypothetical protein